MDVREWTRRRPRRRAAAALFSLAGQGGHEQARNLLAVIGSEPGALPDCMRPPVPEEPAADPSATESVPPPDPFANLPPWKQQIADQVERYAPRYAVEPRLALAVIAAESNFDHLAVSPKGAQGLMQLIPETATRFNVKSPFNVRENLRGGLAYLRWLLAYYQGNVELAVAAYNAGERAVDKYGGVPPFAETREYVRRILAAFPSARHGSIRIRPLADAVAQRPGEPVAPTRGRKRRRYSRAFAAPRIW